ncbi:oxidoreductase [Leptospira sarikeiensis]|uniref:SDR family NAD(P)-dependent oxidoreductase n=1 Tax=Leptospira sarikeiensis TaxID=2484943 RepID=A0A4R9JYR8_9LEPT|nr:oxidoreductase [Leptospira sarikeiensis]TGL58400.1 SDR family NAD(P)-dependent oxidoreductase [Leptospira sarikeiensis]
MEKVWLITGSSRGLGRSLAETVLSEGGIVIAAARNPENLKELKDQYGDRIYPLEMDVSNQKEVEQGIEEAIQIFGRIDVLVNNAGYGFLGAVEEQSDQDIRNQIETNLFGTIYVSKAVVPHMRKQGSGRILQISSIGGRRGVPGLSAYNAAKFGVEGFSEALAQEVSSLGIHVTIVEPGGFRTDWAGSSMDFAPEIKEYGPSVGVMRKYMQNGTLPLGDPNKAALAMMKVVESEEPPLHLLLGSDAVRLFEQMGETQRSELEKWKVLSLSTDADDATSVFDSEASKLFQK